MATWISGGGEMSCSSTRFTLTPHLSEASSSTERILVLISVAVGEGLVEVHLADNVTQRGLGQLLDGVGQVADLIGRAHRVGDLREEQPVDLDDDVVARDHTLLREVHDRLAQVKAIAEARPRCPTGRWPSGPPSR